MPASPLVLQTERRFLRLYHGAGLPIPAASESYGRRKRVKREKLKGLDEGPAVSAVSRSCGDVKNGLPSASASPVVGEIPGHAVTNKMSFGPGLCKGAFLLRLEWLALQFPPRESRAPEAAVGAPGSWTPACGTPRRARLRLRPAPPRSERRPSALCLPSGVWGQR